MKKVIVVLLALMCISVTAFAATALTWDENPPDQMVDMYQVAIDGTIVADIVPNTWVIVDIPDGVGHRAAVRAHNSVGWGAFSSELVFDLPYLFNAPGAVTGVQIIDVDPATLP